MHPDNELGLQRGTVRIAAWNPMWPEQFRLEAQRIRSLIQAAGLAPLALEHIGSTAVPGLAAKPVIDLLAGYEPEGSPRSYFELLLEARYQHRGQQDVPERELFVLGPETARTHHLNLVLVGGPFWREHLLFRDRLRNEPEVAAAYAALKRRLAERHPADRQAYTEGKADFVRRAIEAGA